jgi:hypothetical protein
MTVGPKLQLGHTTDHVMTSQLLHRERQLLDAALIGSECREPRHFRCTPHRTTWWTTSPLYLEGDYNYVPRQTSFYHTRSNAQLDPVPESESFVVIGVSH